MSVRVFQAYTSQAATRLAALPPTKRGRRGRGGGVNTALRPDGPRSDSERLGGTPSREPSRVEPGAGGGPRPGGARPRPSARQRHHISGGRCWLLDAGCTRSAAQCPAAPSGQPAGRSSSARSVAGGGELGGGGGGKALGGGGGRGGGLEPGGGLKAGGGLEAASGVVAAGRPGQGGAG